jgi:hypothetical protein
MNETITYAALDNLLRGLGFTATVLPGPRLHYEHAPSATVLLFRNYRPSDPVSWSDLTVARRFLVERGLIESEAFDRLLQDPAA